MVMGTEVISAFSALFNQGSIEIINFLGQFHNAGSLIFGSEARLDIHPVVSLVAVLAWVGAAVIVLRWRIRPVEVVS